jgi:integrase
MADGIYLTDLWKGKEAPSGLRWRVRVRDRNTGDWASQSFPGDQRRLALEWAKNKRDGMAAIYVGAMNKPPEKVQLPTVDVLTSLVNRVEGKPVARSDGHIEELTRVVTAAIDAGIAELTDEDIDRRAQTWLDSLTHLAPATRRRYTAHLRAIGRHAVRFFAKATNGRDPFLALANDDLPQPDPEVFTVAESRKLVSDDGLDCVFAPAVAVALYTGMRLREVVWLRWPAVDLERKQITVFPPTSDERAAGHKVKRNKRRLLTIQHELLGILKKLPRDGDYLFDEHMRTRNNTQYGRYLRDVLTAVGVQVNDSQGRARSFHSLRHTHISMALAAGVEGMAIQLYAGHSSSAMTKHYAQAMQAMQPDCRKWNGVLFLRRKSP